MFSTQPVGHSSRTITRHAPVARVGRGELHDVLPAVRAVEQQFLAVRRPGDAVDVVPDDVVVERLAVADVDLDGRLRGDVVDEQIDDRIGLAGLRVGLGVDACCRASSGPSAGSSRAPASRRSGSRRSSCCRATTTSRWSGPAPRRRPSCRAVLDAVLLAAVGRDGDLVGAARRRSPTGCGRGRTPSSFSSGDVGRRDLPPALRAPPWPRAARARLPPPAAAGAGPTSVAVFVATSNR